jgi:glutamate-1-semialdehyde 2,1-aminomutase
VPESVTQNTALVPFNDLPAAIELFGKLGEKIAAFILEPVCGNMGVVPPLPGYLDGIRELCDRHKTLLIFDEVMTGFRVALGGAQAVYGVKPDLTCLGKIIGGGLPVGAYGGRPELMNQVSPAGPIYQAGTLSGNPLAMVAGIATLTLLEESGNVTQPASASGGRPAQQSSAVFGSSAYTQLETLSARLEAGLREAVAAANRPICIQRLGSMLTPFFLSQGSPQAAALASLPTTAASTGTAPVQLIRNYADALQCDTAAYAAFFRGMLDRGIMLPPSQFEAWFVSTAHTEADVDQTIDAAKEAFRLAATR